MIEVLEPGIATTVQDLGRFGHYHIGMPPSGAMDLFSHKVANYLLGNEENEANAGTQDQGPYLEIEVDTVIGKVAAPIWANP